MTRGPGALHWDSSPTHADDLFAAEYASAVHWLRNRDDAEVVADRHDKVTTARRRYFVTGGTAEGADALADDALADATFYVRLFFGD